MTDVILALSQNPFARSLAQRAKLPIPLPEKLERQEGPSPERPLEDKTVFIGGGGVLADAMARTIARAGGNPWVAEELAASGGAVTEPVLAHHRARLAALPAEARRVLRAASIFGVGVAPAGIAALLGDDP